MPETKTQRPAKASDQVQRYTTSIDIPATEPQLISEVMDFFRSKSIKFTIEKTRVVRTDGANIET
jgi:hypothetical protein